MNDDQDEKRDDKIASVITALIGVGLLWIFILQVAVFLGYVQVLEGRVMFMGFAMWLILIVKLIRIRTSKNTRMIGASEALYIIFTVVSLSGAYFPEMKMMAMLSNIFVAVGYLLIFSLYSSKNKGSLLSGKDDEDSE